ncbi:MAG TPA: hypothetical protein VF150_11290 [Thermoanaerobaculia bacterium]
MTPATQIIHRPAAPFDSAPEAGELLYRFEAEQTLTPVGLVPEGFRMEVAFDGVATAGAFEGARVWGSDPLLIRADGVGIIDSPKMIALPGGHVYEHVQGYCSPPEGFGPPPPEALLDPELEWPDVLFSIQGFSTFRAATPELAYLNGALARIDGWAHFASRRLAVETRLLPHLRGVAGPARQPAAAS